MVYKDNVFRRPEDDTFVVAGQDHWIVDLQFVGSVPYRISLYNRPIDGTPHYVSRDELRTALTQKRDELNQDLGKTDQLLLSVEPPKSV